MPDRREIESKFRLMAFQIAHQRLYADVQDNGLRFSLALAYSCQRIGDHALVDAWWEWSHGASMKRLIDTGKEPPAILRPLVNSYLLALESRARQTGETVEELEGADAETSPRSPMSMKRRDSSRAVHA